MTGDQGDPIHELDKAIAALEAQRAVLGDAVVDQALAALRKERQALLVAQAGGGAAAIGDHAKAAGAGGMIVDGSVGGDMLGPDAEKTTVVAGDVLLQVYNIYRTPSGKPALTKERFERVLGEYLRWVQNAYSRARLYGLESLQTSRDRPVRRLADVFVPITLLRSGRELDLNDLLIINELHSQQLLIDHNIPLQYKLGLTTKDLIFKEKRVTSSVGRLALTGGAGTGKSTLLAYLASNLANSAQLGTSPPFRLPAKLNDLIPVLIPLRYYHDYMGLCQQSPQMRLASPRAGTLAGFIPWYLRRRNPILEQSDDFFDRLLSGGGCLLMLDGLDEVVSRQERGHMRQQVEDLANDIYPDNLILITARQAGYQQEVVFGDDFIWLEVGPLKAEQIEVLIYNWCRQLYPGEEQEKTKELVSAVHEINAIRTSQEFQPLVSTPLMATMVVSVKWGETELPRERAKLYESAVKVILQAQYTPDDAARKQLVDWGGPWEDQRDWLSLIALEMHRGGLAAAAVSEDRVREILSGKYSDVFDIFIEAVRMRGGLFEERAERFQFAHLTFQEFLAARLLAKRRTAALPDLELIVTDIWWREVLLLLYGFARQDYPPFAQEYLDWLSSLSGSGERRLAGLELAGAAVLELEKPLPDLRQIQAERLLAALLQPNIHAAPTLRVHAGDTLARLGDPRFDERFWYLAAEPLLGFVEIPSGPFLLGSLARLDTSIDRYEHPQHSVELPYYYIGRYTVTIAQFVSFLEDSGYKLQDDRGLIGLSNHSVVYVTWYDALAYCEWLDGKLLAISRERLAESLQSGIGVRMWQCIADKRMHACLPSEAEWEKAARGTDGRIYPWGNVFSQHRYYTQDAQNRSNHAVGCFPQNVSPYDLHDMVGNVREWTRSLWGKDALNPKFRYPYKSTDGRENLRAPASILRVIRGSTYRKDSWDSRCAFRGGDFPNFRNVNLGFRVVVSSLGGD